MTKPTHTARKVKNPLKEMLNQPGGASLEQAVRRAHMELKLDAKNYRKRLKALVSELAASMPTGKGGELKISLRDVSLKGACIADLGAAISDEWVGLAACRLVEFADWLRETEQPYEHALHIYIEGLTLLTMKPDATSDEEKKTLLDRMYAVHRALEQRVEPQPAS